jgi:hypothetical protein
MPPSPSPERAGDIEQAQRRSPGPQRWAPPRRHRDQNELGCHITVDGKEVGETSGDTLSARWVGTIAD